jgi:hypothetical protein
VVQLEASVSPEEGDFVVTPFVLGFGGGHRVHAYRGIIRDCRKGKIEPGPD